MNNMDSWTPPTKESSTAANKDMSSSAAKSRVGIDIEAIGSTQYDLDFRCCDCDAARIHLYVSSCKFNTCMDRNGFFHIRSKDKSRPTKAEEMRRRAGVARLSLLLCDGYTYSRSSRERC